MSNKLVYFPSFSVGQLDVGMRANEKMLNGLPYRFYADDFPAEYRHPYFLVTAGHHLKTLNYKQDYEFDKYKDVVLLGDSGGYQIATGALKWDLKLQKSILDWLELNSTVAMNLDIPPRNKFEFNECLNISADNYRYFEENQTGKIKLLNVLHGRDEITYNVWYDRVKGYNFNGWGVGSIIVSLYRFMCAIMTLMEGKEQYKKTNEWIHFLGVSKIHHFLMLSQLQKSLNDIGTNIKISTDSSTPSRGVVYGIYYYDVDYRKPSFRYLHIPKEREAEVKTLPNDFRLPTLTKFDIILQDEYTSYDIVEWTKNGHVAVILHNFMFFKQTIDEIEHYVYSDPYILKQIVNPDVFLLLSSIDEIVKAYENGTTPKKVFAKYKPHFLKMSSASSMNKSASAVKHNFF